jgi:hypothetical protein
MGTVLWWLGNAIVVVAVFPLVAFLALRIIRALTTVQAAAVDIRSSLSTVANSVPPAMTALSDVAARCERLADAPDRVPA